MIAFPACEGITLHAGPTQAGGASVAWLAALLGRSADDISALAARSDPARPAPIFLPHLQGERAPIWDIAARGAFAGLDASMGAPELARAVLEGVAYSVRWLFEALEASSGARPERLRHAGGGARSEIWARSAPTSSAGRSTASPMSTPGLVGAAMLAGAGAALFATLEEAATRMCRIDRTFEPDRARQAAHDEGFGRYRELYARLEGFKPP